MKKPCTPSSALTVVHTLSNNLWVVLENVFSVEVAHLLFFLLCCYSISPNSHSCHPLSSWLQSILDTAYSFFHTPPNTAITNQFLLEGFNWTLGQMVAERNTENKLKLNNSHFHFRVLPPWVISSIFCRFSLLSSLRLGSFLLLSTFKCPPTKLLS